MLNSIRILEQIQRIDLEMSAIEGEGKSYKDSIERLNSEIEKAGAEVNGIASEIESVNSAVKEIEDRIRQSSEKVSKDEKRLNDVKNDKELNALTKEITTANKAKKAGQQEISGFQAKLDEKKGRLQEKEAALDLKKNELKRLTGEMDEKKAVWSEDIGKKQQMRDSIKTGVRSDILKKYEMIRSKRGGIGMAQVKNETCQGCYIHIPPQVYIQLKKGTEELLSCPHCHRILYVETQGQSEAV